MNYLFGPVTSRRYGQSLGVDLVPMKTCSFSCRFCQIGATPHVSIARVSTPPVADVLAELTTYLATHTAPDYVTASGSGEPTLHARFGDVLRFVRDETPCKALLLSNGSLFWQEDVRRDAACADVVKVSLHAWNQGQFEAIVQPHSDITLARVLDGYRAFREQFTGRLDVEVFIIPGVNDTVNDVAEIAARVATFSPDTVTLNTAIRPAADASVSACPDALLRSFVPLFHGIATVGGSEPKTVAIPFSDDALLGLVTRHPVSEDVLCATFGLSSETFEACVMPHVCAGRVARFQINGVTFIGPARGDEAWR